MELNGEEKFTFKIFSLNFVEILSKVRVSLIFDLSNKDIAILFIRLMENFYIIHQILRVRKLTVKYLILIKKI